MGHAADDQHGKDRTVVREGVEAYGGHGGNAVQLFEAGVLLHGHLFELLAKGLEGDG